MEYPARFTPDKDAGGFVVTFPDLPGVTQGDTPEEAMAMASEALGLALTFYTEKNLDLPVPGKLKRGMRMVRISALNEAKFGLYAAMRAGGIRKAELARRLGCQRSEVERLLDIKHRSRLDHIERAFAVVGKRLALDITDIPDAA
jgi:antitoxin HicB